MANVQDVARFFIHLAQKQEEAQMGDLATNMRVNKLLYFAQGWHLARHGKPLFSAPLYAWQYGPVVPEVYREYNRYGGQGITCIGPNDDAFTPEEYDLLLDVAREYDGLSTAALVTITHKKNAPWSITEQNREIDINAIRDYFLAQQPIASFDDVLACYPVEEA